MKLVVGLGNPGPRYDQTRHNVGFVVIDELARRWNVRVDRFERRWEALSGEAQVGDERVLLLKPQTYMNLSGRSVLAVQQFYKLEPPDLLVICDDLDLPVGRVRVRARGTGGGQKGLENILLRLATIDVPRLRLGIGKVHPSATIEYVLSRFAPDEREAMDEALTAAADAVERWLSEGINAAMNEFNPKHGSKSPDRQPAEDDPSQGETS